MQGATEGRVTTRYAVEIGAASFLAAKEACCGAQASADGNAYANAHGDIVDGDPDDGAYAHAQCYAHGHAHDGLLCES